MAHNSLNSLEPLSFNSVIVRLCITNDDNMVPIAHYLVALGYHGNDSTLQITLYFDFRCSYLKNEVGNPFFNCWKIISIIRLKISAKFEQIHKRGSNTSCFFFVLVK